MTNPPNPRDDLSTAELNEHRCMRYLLDDLSDAERRAFEGDLIESQSLCDVLDEQSQLIVGIAQSRIEAGDPTSPARIVTSVSQTNASSSKPMPLSRHWVAITLAVAASIGLAMLSVRSLMPTDHRANYLNSSVDDAAHEDVLIARAWAIARDQEEGNGWSLEDMEEPEARDSDAILSWTVEDVESDADDGTLQWMYIAVAAESQTPSATVSERHEG